MPNDNTAPMGALPIGKEQLLKLTETLMKYKAGKNRTERRIIASENWWKLRNDTEESGDSAVMSKTGWKSKSGWLHNVIVSKHADAMEAYPEPVILPREAGDRSEAQILSSILPCVLEQAGFEATYSAAMWQKCKTGTGAYKIVWDAGKNNGLGDITIARVNLLNVFWEPGVEDIQQSRYFYHTELCDIDVLEQQYPELHGQLTGNTMITSRFLYDDSVSTDGKVTVIECYYRKYNNGQKVLHYVKYVNDIVLFATENMEEFRDRGLYDHGNFPYVFDPLFQIEGSPCGYGYVDISRNPQTTIDMLNTAFVQNSMAGALPRFFTRQDGGVNEKEFTDLTKAIVHVNGNLGEDAVRQIITSPMSAVHVNYLDRIIDELRQTSGNTETATGNVSSGVTAASAIAALQEASGKGSRDSNMATYRAFTQIVTMCIELIRQFYDTPRTFRITGKLGEERFISYTNAALKAQVQGEAFGIDMGARLPVFDIKVSAAKKSVYTRVSQNELALQFFQMGFFNPQMVDQAIMCMNMMDFEGKDELMQSVARNGALYQKLSEYMGIALMLAKVARPDMVEGLSRDIMQTFGGQMPAGDAAADVGAGERENAIVENARARSAAASQPEGGRVTGGARG